MKLPGIRGALFYSQHPEREHQHSPDKFDYNLQGQPNDPEREQYEPDEGKQHEHNQCKRPAHCQQQKPKDQSDKYSHKHTPANRSPD